MLQARSPSSLQSFLKTSTVPAAANPALIRDAGKGVKCQEREISGAPR